MQLRNYIVKLIYYSNNFLDFNLAFKYKIVIFIMFEDKIFEYKKLKFS
jgi:hypothetical protein